jgi:hypothetical protein
VYGLYIRATTVSTVYGMYIRATQGRVGTGCNCNPISKLFATGVPPHLVLANRFVDLESHVGSMDISLTNRIDRMNVEMRTVLGGLPEELKKNMLQNFRVDGVMPITEVQISNMMESLESRILSSMERLIVARVPQEPAILPEIGGGHRWLCPMDLESKISSSARELYFPKVSIKSFKYLL